VVDGVADRVARALDAADQAQAEPAVARDTALAILAEGDLSSEDRAAAHYAAGMAHRELNQLEPSRRHFDEAIRAARDGGHRELEARARSGLSLVLAYLGDPERGLAEADLAEPWLRGGALGRVRMQRALIQQRMGRLDDALAGYRRALPLLARAGDRVAEVRVRVNRSVASTYRGDLAAAEADLVIARRLAVELGQHLQAAACAHNLAFVLGRRGDVPAALRWFDQARDEYAPLGVAAGFGAVLAADRAELLLAVGLTGEARASADEALAALDGSNKVEEAEARLLAARAALADGHATAAAEHARLAAEAFEAQGRPSWAALAEHVALRAETEAEAPPAPDLAARAAELAERLEGHGWVLEALAARTLAGRLALAAGDTARAREELARAAPARRRGPAGQRAQAWHAEALRRAAEGDDTGALRAAAAGLRVIDDYRATLGATELRAHVSRLGQDLAALGVSLACRRDRPEAVLRWVEAGRAGALVAAAVPPRDPRTAELLAQLRALEADARAEVAGGARPAALDRRRAALEREIRDRARAAPGRSRPSPREPFDAAALHDRLGSRALVAWFERDGAPHVLVAADGRVRVAALDRDAGAVAADEVASARFCLQRLARATGSAASLANARATLDHAGRRLAELLLGPVEALLGDGAGAAGRELVLVPSGALQGVPWAALPPLRERPFAVAPSATAWVAADRRAGPRRPATGPGDVALVAGPDLPGADREVAALAARIGSPPATVLRGQQATVAAARGALAGATVAHVAAHGRFRADNPLFSSLRMVDGELTVHDLDGLARVPRLVVLSACDAATNVAHPGDELLGLSAALLGMGAASLVAPVVPVHDEAAAELMVALHERLQAGDAPAVALHAAARACDGDDPGLHAAVRSFVAFGS